MCLRDAFKKEKNLCDKKQNKKGGRGRERESEKGRG
jgi:hypothetical protein